jgi:stage III sporulation protein AF
LTDFIYRWAAVFLTSAVTLTVFESLLPNEEIKKSALFVGRLIFLLSIIIPVIGLINSGWSLDLWQSYYRYSFEMEENAFSGSVTDDDNRRQIIEDLYYENIVNIIENYVNHIPGVASCKADVILDRTVESDTYGYIKKIYVYVTLDKTKSVPPTAKEIEKRISEYFEVESEYVYVSVM